jgi:hypothetical protein
MILGILVLLQGVGLEISVGIVEHAIYFILFYLAEQANHVECRTSIRVVYFVTKPCIVQKEGKKTSLKMCWTSNVPQKICVI